MNLTIPFLICFPLVIAVLMFFIRINRVRNMIAYISAVIIMIGVVVLTAQWIYGGRQTVGLYYDTVVVDNIILFGQLILCCFITFLCLKYKKYLISLLSIIPTGITFYIETSGMPIAETNHMYLDRLSLLMCLIIGIIGGLIVIYAVGYMHGYHHHHTEFKDRRYYFFALLFLFLGVMFAFVLSSSLLWIDLFWEITSVCSFLLIGYTRTKEAITNSFRALWMNLLGGCALILAIWYDAYVNGTVSLQTLVESGVAGDKTAIIPIALIAFAALTKAAQMPFSKWLMGAMVAPTPSSALLHSATMVKAGIYILFRLSPAMYETTTGMMISFVGGFTFFAASVMAIAQSDGKKVLAFSTISNLGLMVACAGVGTEETIWAGVFLMIFHSISKSLLFQDVGATENALHSRDIEDMHGLLYRLPKLGAFMFIGIAGMFLAPFGMLISKWAALRASVDTGNVILVLFICFGSATTMFYWTKWMAKIISYSDEEKVKDITKKNEMLSLTIHSVLMIVLCILFPILSKVFVEPLLSEMFGKATSVLPMGLLYILVVMICFIFAVPLLAFYYSKNVRANQKLSYMNGVNEGNNKQFVDAFGNPKELQISNFYFKDFFGQRKLMLPCEIITASVIIVMLCMIIGGAAL